MLLPGYEVVTGRRHQRVWKVGGLLPHDDRTLTGQLGWLPKGEEVVPQWSDEEKAWVSSISAPHGGRVMPFGFDGESRLLTVLSDRSSAAPTLGAVFEKILRANEAELPEEQRSTEWSVEPVLDAHEFIEWLRDLDVVRSVSFTARLPNPEPRDAFKDLADRMAARRATHFTETIRSESDEGLVGIDEDPDVRQAIAMSKQGFATLRGRGIREGLTTKFSQSDTVATEHVDAVPDHWNEVWVLIREYLKGRLRRFLDEAA